MSPLPGTRTIPEGWSAHHVGAASGGMNAAVTVGERTGEAHDPETDDTTATWSQDYVGPARIQALNEARLSDLTGQPVAGRAYLVQLDSLIAGGTKLTPGMRVRCTSAINDPALVGQDLWLVDFQRGSERFTRDLVCSDNQTDAPSA